jgi:hypothetical protein
MGEAHLASGEREYLRGLTAQLAAADPRIITRGTQIADELRRSFPGLADETIAAVLYAAVCTGLTYARLTGCQHMASHHRLLAAAVADLAHLELDPPGRS